jgi:hypothetical protein
MHVYMYVCMYVCMHACIDMYVLIYIYIYIYIYTCWIEGMACAHHDYAHYNSLPYCLFGSRFLMWPYTGTDTQLAL